MVLLLLLAIFMVKVLLLMRVVTPVVMILFIRLRNLI